MLAGSYGLSEFTDLRVKQREENSRFLTAEESKKFLKQDKKPVESLDSMLEVWLNICSCYFVFSLKHQLPWKR